LLNPLSIQLAALHNDPHLMEDIWPHYLSFPSILCMMYTPTFFAPPPSKYHIWCASWFTAFALTNNSDLEFTYTCGPMISLNFYVLLLTNSRLSEPIIQRVLDYVANQLLTLYIQIHISTHEAALTMTFDIFLSIISLWAFSTQHNCHNT